MFKDISCYKFSVLRSLENNLKNFPEQLPAAEHSALDQIGASAGM